MEEHDRIELADGDVLFSFDDPGGDLFLIEEGNIEVFRERESIHVTLSYMHRGEIIGLLTCLNQKNRTASAKASGPVVLRKIPSTKIRKTLDGLPKWIETILKEFSHRIHDMQDMILTQSRELESAKAERVDATYHTALICGCLSTLASYHKYKNDSGTYVVLEEINDQVAECLGIPPDRVRGIIQVLHDGGLLKMERDPDKDRILVPFDIMVSIFDMAQFIRDSRLGLTKKIANFNYKDKTFRVGRAICVFASKTGANTKKEVRLGLGDLEANLKRKTTCAFSKDCLEDLETLKLLKITKESVCFIPAKLGRTLAHVDAYQKLKNYKDPAKAAAAS